ncbi:MAG: T9SS type A sorting domain-containing protein [Bacteroidales bacterium]|nr:T9SS type A sorting domain-containing protein [Bacteroidales bacterium]
MKKKLLLFITALLFAGAVKAQTNYWGDDPNSHAQPSNTPIVASVTIDGEAVEASDAMRLGAFVGDELRGIAAPHTDGNFWIQVFYDSEAQTAETISFRLYDGETEYATCATTLTGSDEGYGTPSAPEVMDFTTTQTQTVAIASGWNWWSTPIEMNDVDGLTMLENGLGNNGLTIKSQNGSVTNWYTTVGYDYWWGDGIVLQNESGYRIEVANNGTFNMTGTLANPDNHAITIEHGWNWIGYPVNATQNISTALNNLTPAANDVIKGQGWSSSYWDNYGWFPTDGCDLTPNKGYMYYSNASNSKQFVYSSSRNFDVTQKSELQSELQWKNNVYEYADNISVIAVAYINDVEQRSESCEIGAFVDGVCRGSARLTYFEPLDRWYAVLTISGKEKDRIEFRLLDDERNSVEGVEKVSFAHDMILGSLDSPFSLHFGLNNEITNINVFPNPIEIGETFNLDLPQDEVVVRMTISDALGSVVRCETGVIDHTSIRGLFTSGIYMMEVELRSGSRYHGKLVVK